MSEADGVHYSRFRVGAISVGVTGRRADDVALARSLTPFRVEMYQCDVNVTVEWVSDLGLTPGQQLFDSGATWRLYQREDGFQFDFIARDQLYKRLLVDGLFREATLQMSAGYFDSFLGLADPLSYPLDELLIMHRLTQEKAIELHSTGIVRADGIGNLFVGHSGAGKSTTTRLWTEREDVEVLSDDRIIVRRESPDDPTRMRMYGTPWHGEAMYASPNSAPLARIFILEHGHGNAITPLPPNQAVAELFARSFVPFHRHEYVESALTFLQELVDAVPVYHYAFEPTEAAVDKVREFRD